MDRVGQRVAMIRSQKDIAQLALAQAAGVPPSSLSNWESGTAMPADVVPKLATALGVTINEQRAS